jgi:hypothetical protein
VTRAKKGSNPKKNRRSFLSPEGRLVTCEDHLTLLWAYGRVFDETVRAVYRRCFARGEDWATEVRKELISKQGWPEDLADSIYDTAKAAHDSAVESTTLALEQARTSLEAVTDKLAWAMRGESTHRVRQRHGLARRRDILRCRVERLERRLAEGDVRVFFGGKKLALAGNAPTSRGYASRGQWRAVFDRARSGTIYAKGDAEASLGNLWARVRLSSETGQTDALLLRVPEVQMADGRSLRDLSVGAEWVEIPVEGLSYGRDVLVAAQRPTESAQVARSRWKENQDIFRAFLETPAAHDAAVTRYLKAPPKTPYKARRASKAVSVRVFWREPKSAWYVAASVEVGDPSLVLGPSRGLRRRFPRVLGVDCNPSHLAWCLVDPEGNPLRWGRIDWDLSGDGNQVSDAIGVAVAELVHVAKVHSAPIAHEALDFGAKSRSDLRYLPRRLSRLLSSFAYSKFASTLASRCAREQVARIPVNPAWTSVLGQANYAGPYGVSVDQGAACAIGRRALGLRERVRPAVARRVPRSAPGGQMPSLRAVAKALSSGPHRAGRRSTWDPSGLCLRGEPRRPAPTTGPQGKGAVVVRPAPALRSHRDPTADLESKGKPLPSSDAVSAARSRAERIPGDDMPTTVVFGHLSNDGQRGK